MKRIIIALTLAMALVLGVVALAEATDSTLPAEQTEQTAPENAAAEPPVAEETTPEDAAAQTPATEEATLQDALKALDDARFSTRMDELQAELNDYVAAGKLTQEQADLIMNSMKEKQSDSGFNGRKGGRNRQSLDSRQFPGQQGGGQMPQMPNAQDGQFPGQQGGQFLGRKGGR